MGARYEVVYREPPRWLFWRRDEREFAYVPGDAVYCFAAIFAPAAFTERVWHYWQRRDDSGTWITTDRIAYTVVGGRDGGYRGYTFKRKLAPGQWRVEVRTAGDGCSGASLLSLSPLRAGLNACEPTAL